MQIMSQNLFDYYEAELNYIRASADEFSRANPEVAANLGLGAGERPDPHVQRLIEAFAFLTARIQRKLNDELPELTDTLLESLYPHYVAPVPSSVIVQFALNDSQAEMAAGVEVPRSTVLESELVGGHRLRFRTGHSARALPLRITSATVRPLSRTVLVGGEAALTELRITFKCFNPDMPISRLKLDPLSLCLAHDPRIGARLYELVLADTLEVSVAPDAESPDRRVLDLSCLQPLGLEPDEGLLPLPANAQPAYRLLSEYAAFPHRLLFFQVGNFPKGCFEGYHGQFDLVFALRRPAEMLERQVNASHFSLGCAPAINLFSGFAEPVRLGEAQHRVRITPNFRPPEGYEVYSIDKLVTRSSSGEERLYVPFYSHWEAPSDDDAVGYFQMTREVPIAQEKDAEARTQVYVSLVDLSLVPQPAPQTTLHATLTCFNGDASTRFGSVQRLQMASGGAVSVNTIGPPTSTVRRDHRNASRWRLISHLNLNQMAISGERGAEVIRQVLRLYAGSSDNPEHLRAAADALISLTCRPAVARASEGPGGMCRGVEIEIVVDKAKLADGGPFMLGTVLERFFALLCSVNSFTRLSLRTAGDNRLIKRWPPRAGAKLLI
jgi:type VI secretion system protein ImpG